MTQPDPTLEVIDGTRALLVTVTHRDSSTVLQTHQLRRIRPSNFTRGMLFCGGVGLVGAATSLVLGSLGLGALLLVTSCGFGVGGWLRKRRERQSPDLLVGTGPEAHLPLRRPLQPLVLTTKTGFQLAPVAGLRGSVRAAGDSVERPLSELQEGEPLMIAAGASLQLQLGPYSVTLRSEAPSRQLNRAPLLALDRQGRLSHSGSLTAHGLVLALALLMPPAFNSISSESFQQRRVWLPLQERPREILGSWVPTRASLTLVEGTGVRASGSEGQMGNPVARRRSALFALRGPKTNPNPRLARRLAQEAVDNSTVLRLLGQAAGGPLASAFGGDSAVGYDAKNAMGNLIGGQIGEAYGVGGLGLVGTGRGGGAHSDKDRGFVGLGSMGDVGRGMGVERGSGYGMAGGVGGLAGYRAGGPVGVVAGRANVTGSLDKETIRRVIRRHINEWRYCYEKELQSNPNLYGRVTVRFVIGPKGRVLSSSISDSTMGSSVVETCIAQAVRRWQFPAPKGGGVVHVNYPVVVRSAG